MAAPTAPFTLAKVDAGELIFDNANTYTTATTVSAGILNIRDSQALGPNGGGGTTVNAGATLELQVDSGLDPHGRNLASDSVLGLNGPGPQLGLRIQTSLTLNGTGVGGIGALDSVSGINTWTGGITLSSADAGIGVNADPNASNTNVFFAHDYSLTVSGVINDVAPTIFHKEDAGDLILPNANNITGAMQIEQGWVTIENNLSLGGAIKGADTIQPTATVLAGAALALLAPTGSSLDLVKNLVLSGNGITQPFDLISQKGAAVEPGRQQHDRRPGE